MDQRERAQNIIKGVNREAREFNQRMAQRAAIDEARRKTEAENKRRQLEAITRLSYIGTGVIEIFEGLVDLNPVWKIGYMGNKVKLVTETTSLKDREDYIDCELGVIVERRFGLLTFVNKRLVGIDGNLDKLISLALAQKETVDTV